VAGAAYMGGVVSCGSRRRLPRLDTSYRSDDMRAPLRG
jgi:hypothetical protein